MFRLCRQFCKITFFNKLLETFVLSTVVSLFKCKPKWFFYVISFMYIMFSVDSVALKKSNLYVSSVKKSFWRVTACKVMMKTWWKAMIEFPFLMEVRMTVRVFRWFFKQKYSECVRACVCVCACACERVFMYE